MRRIRVLRLFTESDLMDALDLLAQKMLATVRTYTNSTCFTSAVSCLRPVLSKSILFEGCDEDDGHDDEHDSTDVPVRRTQSIRT